MLWYSIPMEVIYMSQVKVTNKKSGITYVYESESYWDKEKKQPRNKRKLSTFDYHRWTMWKPTNCLIHQVL